MICVLCSAMSVVLEVARQECGTVCIVLAIKEGIGYIFFFFHENAYYGYSLEVPHHENTPI